MNFDIKESGGSDYIIFDEAEVMRSQMGTPSTDDNGKPKFKVSVSLNPDEAKEVEKKLKEYFDFENADEARTPVFSFETDEGDILTGFSGQSTSPGHVEGQEPMKGDEATVVYKINPYSFVDKEGNTVEGVKGAPVYVNKTKTKEVFNANIADDLGVSFTKSRSEPTASSAPITRRKKANKKPTIDVSAPEINESDFDDDDLDFE